MHETDYQYYWVLQSLYVNGRSKSKTDSSIGESMCVGMDVSQKLSIDSFSRRRWNGNE
jgi:hypothetical protein